MGPWQKNEAAYTRFPVIPADAGIQGGPKAARDTSLSILGWFVRSSPVSIFASAEYGTVSATQSLYSIA